jgi:hypothetical protein
LLKKKKEETKTRRSTLALLATKSSDYIALGG